MLRYFYKNKLKYNEGQLAPFFIAILAILIILALISINLGKVASIRTESTNAADSGALSAGTMMAVVFNQLASANAEMEKAYWTFVTSVSVSLALALAALIYAHVKADAAVTSATTAMGLACPAPCVAIAPTTAAIVATGAAIWSMGRFITLIKGVLIAVLAFHIAQWYFYKNIRETVYNGRENAVGGGHSYAFSNSGVASRLKTGVPPDDVTDPKQRRNYRDEFDEFLDDIEHSEHYAYDWEDGQEREHNVETNVSIGDVDTYDLQVAVNSFFIEEGLLIAMAYFVGPSAVTSLSTAEGCYGLAEIYLAVACGCQACCTPLTPNCCACWAAFCLLAELSLAAGIAACETAIGLIYVLYGLWALAEAGIWPGYVVESNSAGDAWPYIICWIDNIEHDRLVRVDIDQHHEGTDLGLWETRYPHIHSYCVADFTGTGQIHPVPDEDEYHDASIIETD